MQTAIVIAIVAAAAFFSVRWLFRFFKGRQAACHCAMQQCPYQRDCAQLEEEGGTMPCPPRAPDDGETP